MEDESKYGHIQFEYVYKGDEFGGRPRKVVFSIPTPDMTMDELVEEFEYFLKAIGYYFNPSEHLGVVLDDMPYPDEWNPTTGKYTTMHDENGNASSIGVSGADGNYDLGAGDYSIMQNEADLYPPVSEEEEKAIEAALWDNTFKKKAEQMGDTIAKEYEKNVLP